MKTLVTLIFIVVLTTACTQPERTTRTLETQGYTNIQTQNWNFFTLFQCSEDDIFRTPFSAQASNGNRIQGIACSGILKGLTIRYE